VGAVCSVVLCLAILVVISMVVGNAREGSA